MSSDKHKTKAQLIAELEKLREQVAELEAAEDGRRQAEDALRESEARYRSVITAMAEGVIIQSADGAIQTCNASAEHILGLSLDQVIVMEPHWHAIHEDGSPFPSETHPAIVTLRTGQPCLDVLMGIHNPDGGMIWISVNTQPIFKRGTARPYAVVSSFRDITGQVQAQEALQKAYNELEMRVAERTADLVEANQRLQREVVERVRAEEALRRAHGELETKVRERTKELIEANKALETEISERMRAEEALRESERRFRDAFENVQLVAVWLDLKGNVIFCNDFLLNLTGWKREEVISQNWFELFIPDAFVGQVFEKEAAKGTIPLHFENDIVTRRGERRTIAWNNTVLRDPEGAVTGMASIGEDITERKRAEEALRESEGRFRSTFEQAAVGIAHVAPDGQFLRINQRFCDIVGYAREEMLARTFQDITYPDDLEADLEFVRQVLANKLQTYSMEKRYIRKNGSLVWVNLTVSLMREPLGEPKYFISVVENITERKRAEEALRQAHKELAAKAAALEEANAELEQYAYVVSHDLRAPLRAIHNYADFLREDLEGKLDEDQEAYLDGLRTATREAETLVSDLLELSQLGRRSAPTETVDSGRLLQEVAASLALPDDVNILMGKHWPTFDTDPVIFKQIFQNLISNAAKFNTSPRKQVELGWQLTLPLPGAGGVHPEPAEGVGEGLQAYEFYVRDNGIGIDPRYHAQIFRVFERLHTSDEYEGTGIGLAIVKKGASKLGGTVWVESAPGEGSTFFVTLPETVNRETSTQSHTKETQRDAE